MVDDTIASVEPSHKNGHEWEDDSSSDVTAWNFFGWTELRDLSIDTQPDALLSDDGLTIDTNKLEASDASSADDAETATISDDGIVVEDAGSEDAFAGVTEQLDRWNTADWGEIRWAVENN